jgi:hypothetical protein
MSLGLTRCFSVAFASFAWTPDIAGNLSSRNSMKISFKLRPEAGNKNCREGHFGYAAQDEDPKCCKDTLITGDAQSL